MIVLNSSAVINSARTCYLWTKTATHNDTECLFGFSQVGETQKFGKLVYLEGKLGCELQPVQHIAWTLHLIRTLQPQHCKRQRQLRGEHQHVKGEKNKQVLTSTLNAWVVLPLSWSVKYFFVLARLMLVLGGIWRAVNKKRARFSWSQEVKFKAKTHNDLRSVAAFDGSYLFIFSMSITKWSALLSYMQQPIRTTARTYTSTIRQMVLHHKYFRYPHQTSAIMSSTLSAMKWARIHFTSSNTISLW